MAASTAARYIHKLFVGNLPWTVGHNELKQYFSQFGHVSDAKVIFNRETGLSKHFGFIEINNKNTYEKILCHQAHQLEGKILAVRDANE